MTKTAKFTGYKSNYLAKPAKSCRLTSPCVSMTCRERLQNLDQGLRRLPHDVTSHLKFVASEILLVRRARRCRLGRLEARGCCRSSGCGASASMSSAAFLGSPGAELWHSDSNQKSAGACVERPQEVACGRDGWSDSRFDDGSGHQIMNLLFFSKLEPKELPASGELVLPTTY